MNTKITDVRANEIFNGIWEPTLEVEILVGDMIKGTSIAPTGQSTGMYEAKEVRDGGERFQGKGCLCAVKNVETEIRNLLIGMDVTDQKKIDMAIKELDGTPDKSRLGSNATSAVSCAVMSAAAKTQRLPVYKYINKDACVLPIPMTAKTGQTSAISFLRLTTVTVGLTVT